MSTPPRTFGARLKAARQRAGLTLDELGERIGAPKQRIHLLERQAEATPEIVYRLAAALGVEPTELAPDVPLVCRWDGPSAVRIEGTGFLVSLKKLHAEAAGRSVVIEPPEAG